MKKVSLADRQTLYGWSLCKKSLLRIFKPHIFPDAVARIVAEHKESFDEENLKDFMDFFIKEEKKQGAAAEGFTVFIYFFRLKVLNTIL